MSIYMSTTIKLKAIAKTKYLVLQLAMMDNLVVQSSPGVACFPEIVTFFT